MPERRYTMAEAVEAICDGLHLCDIEAQEIADRIAQPRGRPNQCPDGVQVLEDAERIIRASAKYAEERPATAT